MFNDSRLISISSETADAVDNGTYLSSCSFNFPNMLQDEDDILYTTISVQSAQIPISYYIVNEYNNRLSYQIGTSAVTSITFSEGNYNATSFIDEWKLRLPSITLTLNKTTGKFLFTRSGSFKFFSSDSSCFKLLGLNPDDDYYLMSPPYTLASPFPCQFQGITRVTVASNALTTYAMDSREGNYSNAIATIPVNSGSYGILLYQNTIGFKPLLREKALSLFDIQLLDDSNNLINFNNVHWNITLQMDITRKLIIVDKTFPIPTTEIPADNSVDVLEEDVPEEDVPQGVPLKDSSGDDDLDFLLFKSGILDRD